jgi:hypothetical protein
VSQGTAGFARLFFEPVMSRAEPMPQSKKCWKILRTPIPRRRSVASQKYHHSLAFRPFHQSQLISVACALPTSPGWHPWLFQLPDQVQVDAVHTVARRSLVLTA